MHRPGNYGVISQAGIRPEILWFRKALTRIPKFQAYHGHRGNMNPHFTEPPVLAALIAALNVFDPAQAARFILERVRLLD